jgi:Type I phosphodiesterase / nucleotide pyrophosphatase
VRREGPQRYVYAYYSDLDSLAHAYGIGSDEAEAELGRIDAQFARFIEEVAGSDTLVIVTADHGFIDIRPETMIELDDHPELADTLMLPLCGEPRIAYCYVRPGASETFERYIESRLGHCAHVMPSDNLIAQGWFGRGELHPRLADRIGHYTLLMKDGYAIRDRVPGDRRHPLIGVHGGPTEDEMLVPLVVARC